MLENKDPNDIFQEFDIVHFDYRTWHRSVLIAFPLLFFPISVWNAINIDLEKEPLSELLSWVFLLCMAILCLVYVWRISGRILVTREGIEFERFGRMTKILFSEVIRIENRVWMKSLLIVGRNCNIIIEKQIRDYPFLYELLQRNVPQELLNASNYSATLELKPRLGMLSLLIFIIAFFSGLLAKNFYNWRVTGVLTMNDWGVSALYLIIILFNLWLIFKLFARIKLLPDKIEFHYLLFCETVYVKDILCAEYEKFTEGEDEPYYVLCLTVKQLNRDGPISWMIRKTVAETRKCIQGGLLTGDSVKAANMMSSYYGLKMINTKDKHKE